MLLDVSYNSKYIYTGIFITAIFPSLRVIMSRSISRISLLSLAMFGPDN